jgi:hypothetical protein
MSFRLIGAGISFCLIVGCCASARAALVLNTGPQIATQAGNLVTNGSFETGAPAPGFANALYWATGTTNTPFAVPAGWTSTGQPSTYAYWGADGISGQGTNFSDVLPNGVAGMYFGNGLTTVSPGPSFNTNGTVTFPLPPTFTPQYGGPVTLAQTVPTDVNPAPSYVLNFWVSGEEAVNPSLSASTWGEGLMGVKLTNVLAGDPIQYLAIPSFTSANPSRRYEYFFTPINPLLPVKVEFTNWGHIGTVTPTTTELVLDDVIVNKVPEPGMVGFAGIALLMGTRRRR